MTRGRLIADPTDFLTITPDMRAVYYLNLANSRGYRRCSNH